jgi:hypothetical protein
MKRIAWVVLIVATPCFGQTWSLITTTDKAEFYVDTASLRPQGTYMKAWIHSKYNEYQTDSVTGNWYKGFRSLLYADCKARTMTTKQFAVYADDVGQSTPQRSHSYHENALHFEDVIPGSVGVAIIDRLCAKR